MKGTTGILRPDRISRVWEFFSRGHVATTKRERGGGETSSFPLALYGRRERSGRRVHLRYLTSRRCRWCISCLSRCVVRPHECAAAPKSLATLRATRKTVESTSVGSDLTSTLSPFSVSFARSPSLSYPTVDEPYFPATAAMITERTRAPLVPHRCPSATRKPESAERTRRRRAPADTIRSSAVTLGAVQQIPARDLDERPCHWST